MPESIHNSYRPVYHHVRISACVVYRIAPLQHLRAAHRRPSRHPLYPLCQGDDLAFRAGKVYKATLQHLEHIEALGDAPIAVVALLVGGQVRRIGHKHHARVVHVRLVQRAVVHPHHLQPIQVSIGDGVVATDHGIVHAVRAQRLHIAGKLARKEQRGRQRQSIDKLARPRKVSSSTRENSRTNIRFCPWKGSGAEVYLIRIV